MSSGAVIAGGRRIPLTPVAQVGENNGGSSTNTGTWTIALPTITGGILALDLIVVWVTYTRGSSAQPTLTAAGFTPLYVQPQTSASLATGMACYAKIAAGGETSMTITSSQTANHTYLTRVYRGASGLPSAITPTGANTGTGSYNANTVTPASVNDIIVTGLGGRGPTNGNVSPSWGGGAASSFSTLSGRVAYLFAADQTGTTSATTHTVSTSNAQGGPSTIVGSIVIPSAA